MRLAALAPLVIAVGCGASPAGPAAPGLLPVLRHPVVACPDPVAGVWRAVSYDASGGIWTLLSLRIHREGAALTGTIVARSWGGGPLERRPVCDGAQDFDQTVRMPASGTIQGPGVGFGATHWQLVRERCPTAPAMGYNPDQFTGTLGPDGVLRLVDNDGGSEVGSPVRFERIRCEAPDAEQDPGTPAPE